MDEELFYDEYDYCYECTGYGDDYSEGENGELVSNCENCPYGRCDTLDD